jgi:hypothetical protein
MSVITNTSLSKATSYQEIGEFWDNHDLTDFWEHTQAVTFDVDIQAEQRYCRVDHSLAEQVGNIARQRGISTETLLNLWLQEKITQVSVSR